MKVLAEHRRGCEGPAAATPPPRETSRGGVLDALTGRGVSWGPGSRQMSRGEGSSL